MKNQLWLFQIPVILLFTSAYLVTEQGLQGDLSQPFVAESVYPKLQRVISLFSDAKFLVRGQTRPKNNIKIVAVDNGAIDRLGRWPWHRDRMAQLIQAVFDAGAKVVGLDMVFSEPDPRVPSELKRFLAEKGLAPDVDRFETDPALQSVIFEHADRLVLGVAAEASCRPNIAYRGRDASGKALFNEEECPVELAGVEVQHNFPEGYERFALQDVALPAGFDAWRTPVMTGLSYLVNLPDYNQVAQHAGAFDAYPDHDHVIRRSQLVTLYNGRLYPALPFEMARVGLGEKVDVRFDPDHRVERITLARSGREIPVTHKGSMEINFRGKAETFPYISASEFFPPAPDEGAARGLASEFRLPDLKDAYVLIGVTAVGVFDMRAFPMDPNVPGVEGHANILDNLLSGDMLRRDFHGQSSWILVMMILGALAFALAVQRLDAIPALVLFIAVYSGVGVVDFKVLFERNVALNTGFLYLELFTVFFLIVAAKYVIEERSKKFVRSAFAKYVAPAVVDSILKDPEKLTVGGEKRDLTIMFSDIRSFTTFSERMDARQLAAFLNDYLGTMTKIVFANEGTLDKYIGDAIMAFWGAPLDQPKHALNSCKAAVAMMKALGENKKRYLEQYGVDVNIGVGINSGPVNVGNMGSSDNFAYTVIGDHVNLSSRLEGLTKAYGVAILTTRFTFDEIVKAGDEPPPHRVLDHVKVKGKKKAVELIQVLDRPLSPEGLAVFEEGRKLYAEQRWDLAIDRFREASSLLSPSLEEKDGPCEVFIERCQEFKANPPEKDWNGEWEMHSK